MALKWASVGRRVPLHISVRKARDFLRKRSRASVATLVRSVTESTLSVLVLGTIGARFSLVLNAPAEMVSGVVLVGCLTAFLETKIRSDDRDRK